MIDDVHSFADACSTGTHLVATNVARPGAHQTPVEGTTPSWRRPISRRGQHVADVVVGLVRLRQEIEARRDLPSGRGDSSTESLVEHAVEELAPQLGEMEASFCQRDDVSCQSDSSLSSARCLHSAVQELLGHRGMANMHAVQGGVVLARYLVRIAHH